MKFAEEMVEVAGCRIRLRRAGKGKPLLYLHGANGVPTILPFMEKLAERYDVLVPEHPGFGASDEPQWLENIHDVAYFYLDFLKKQNLKDVVLMGGSLGGWIALEIAVRDTSRLAELLLIAPAGIAAPGVQPADIFLMPPEDVVRALYHDPTIADTLLALPVSPEAIDIGLKNRHTTARLGWEPRMHDPHLPKWLHRIDVPVRIIWGDKDAILPVKFVDEFKRRLPKAEIHIIKNAGHLPQVEKVDEFIKLVCR